MPPKPKPRALKVIKGERSDRIPDPLPAPIGELTRPGWLLPEAKREWNRLVPQLERWGLAIVDRAALAELCQEWARYVECQKAIDEHPAGSPWRKRVAVESGRHADRVRMLAQEFGLTLASRGRISLPQEADGHAAERFLSG